MSDDSTAPRVKFRHMEEEKWHEGPRRSSYRRGARYVREKWLEFSDKLSLARTRAGIPG